MIRQEVIHNTDSESDKKSKCTDHVGNCSVACFEKKGITGENCLVVPFLKSENHYLALRNDTLFSSVTLNFMI